MIRPRVLLADDHPMVMEGLRKLLEGECEVVGTAEDGRAVVEAVQRLKPDVVVLDISMPELTGLEAARHIKNLIPATKVIFLTMHGDPLYAHEAFQVGASGYLLKRSAATELIKAIHAVLSGRTYLTPLLRAEEFGGDSNGSGAVQARSGRLTPRQREVLKLVAQGKSTKDIASVLHISVKTVEFHKSKIMEKLGVHTTAELTKYALTHGLTFY